MNDDNAPIAIPSWEQVCEALGCDLDEFSALHPLDRWDLIEAHMNDE